METGQYDLVKHADKWVGFRACEAVWGGYSFFTSN